MRYRIRVLDEEQIISTRTIIATNEDTARMQLLGSGLVIISLRQTVPWFSARDTFPVYMFAQELHALLLAGLNVVESLELLVEKDSVPSHKFVLTTLLGGIREGQSLSIALSAQAEIFSELFVGLMQSAEGTSSIPSALAKYIEYESRVNNVLQKAKSAAVYPAILMAVGGAVTMFLMIYVVPKFSAVYEGSVGDLPMASQLLLSWGVFASQYESEVLAFMFMCGAAAFWFLRRAFKHGEWWHFFMVLPVLRRKFEDVELSRLYLTVGTLLESGQPVLHALSLARPLLRVTKHEALELAKLRITEGQAFSNAFAEARLLTPVASRLVKVGEKSGQLAPMLLRTSVFHDGDFSRWIDKFARAFEPILMTVIGLIVGMIVVLLYIPIFDLAGSL